MRAIARRLQRLEKRFGPVEETREEKVWRARFEAARLRSGAPPPSPERLAELRGMSICQILNAARDRLALAAPRAARDLKCRAGDRP
jgi:hypothetical protein